MDPTVARVSGRSHHGAGVCVCGPARTGDWGSTVCTCAWGCTGGGGGGHGGVCVCPVLRGPGGGGLGGPDAEPTGRDKGQGNTASRSPRHATGRPRRRVGSAGDVRPLFYFWVCLRHWQLRHVTLSWALIPPLHCPPPVGRGLAECEATGAGGCVHATGAIRTNREPWDTRCVLREAPPPPYAPPTNDLAHKSRSHKRHGTGHWGYYQHLWDPHPPVS